MGLMDSQTKIDINADIGEGWNDAALVPFVDSVNIACGGHTGDEASMRTALELAARHKLRSGAHPSYPDHDSFGRLPMAMAHDTFCAVIGAQITALSTLAKSGGVTLTHVKAHGALYHALYVDASLARAFTSLIPKSLAVVTMPGGALAASCADAGIPVWFEGYADRGYTKNGNLAPRGTLGSLITDPELAARQALLLANGKPFPAIDGGQVALPRLNTICIHSDTPGAAAIAKAVAHALRSKSP